MREARRRDRGQAAVEAALTLPLTLFLILGTLQLFMMLQARLMAEHAVFRATRTGSLSQGSCDRMLQAATTLLLPTFARTDGPQQLAQAFAAHKNNRYQPASDGGLSGDIVWLLRPSPRGSAITGAEKFDFDDPDRPLTRLEVKLVFWYPLRIPFANWVIAHMALAAWGLGDYGAVDPLMPAHVGHWGPEGPPPPAGDDVLATFAARAGNPPGTYVFPIEATATMRMMTPPRAEFFSPQDCK